MTSLPQTDREIELLLSTPTKGAVEAVKGLPGDFMVLGVGGKMGTTTAVMLRRALDEAGRRDAVVTGVSRFSRPEARTELEGLGVRTLSRTRLRWRPCRRPPMSFTSPARNSAPTARPA
jgi:hypothetical protein